ncbi:hypothetical protein M9458_048577, partial [Cirrhinus mrigala]
STTLASGSPMALPACYSGEAAKCNGFLLQCTLYFEMQPQRFPTERSKTAFITSLLSGRALDWADALWQAENPIIGSLTSFVKHFKEVFGKATGKLSPSDELYRLRQGSSSVSDYTLRFRTVATLSGWNEPALCSAYRQGLNIGIRQQLVIFDDAIGLEALMQKTVQIAQRLSACVPESHGQLAASPNPDKILPTPEPMQTDSYHLSATERIRRVSQGLCLYCGENGHALNSCPVRPPRPFVSIMQVFPDVISMSQLSVRLLIKNSIFTVKALVDSGASGNFISFNTLKDLNLPALPQEPQYRINTIRGEPLGPGRIKHRSPVCQLRIGNFLCPIIWDLDRQLQEATSLEPVPPGGPEDKVYVPSSMRSALLDSVHSSPGSGHPGSKRTLSLLRSRFWWPQMAREVSQHVHACSVCAMTNTPRQLPCGKLVPLPIPTRPWSHIGIDFVTDLPSSNNYTCILVIVDRFSKSCKFIPLSCLPTAMETAEALLHSIFRYYGLPEDIVSDRGPQFISRVWHAFFRNLQISVSLSSGYHPQTNGQTERKIQELGRYLRAYCSSNQHDWSRYLPWAEYAQNSLRQSTTGLTPFQCVLGYQPALFPWSGEPSNVPAVDHWFRESERVWDSAHVHLQHAVRSHKIFADVRRRPAPTFQPGELVWLSTKDIRLRLPCKKLSPRYIGPFPIQRQLNPVTYQLQLPSHYRIHPAFHVSLLKPATNPPLPPSTESDGTEVPPPPEILEDPSIYRVKEILDSRRRGGQIEYLIDWEGYGPEERSWIPRKDILDPTLLSEFHQQHPERPAPRPRGRPRHHFRASGAA